jgi:hypothetical protein
LTAVLLLEQKKECLTRCPDDQNQLAKEICNFYVTSKATELPMTAITEEATPTM